MDLFPKGWALLFFPKINIGGFPKKWGMPRDRGPSLGNPMAQEITPKKKGLLAQKILDGEKICVDTLGRFTL